MSYESTHTWSVHDACVTNRTIVHVHCRRLTPQGDRVQRRSLHATRTHTYPFGQTRHAVSCIACTDIPPHAYDACHTMSRHYRVSTNATRADCTHAIHYCTCTCTSCTKIDDRYYFRNEQTPNPFPQTTSFRF